MNLGYWKSAKSYGEACQSLAEVIGQEAQLCEADEVLCVGCGQGQELQFFRERFHPTRLQGLDAHGTRPEAPEEIRVGRVEEMAHGVNHIRCGEFSKILAVDCVYHFQKARFLRDSAKLARESLSMTDVVLRPDAPWWIRLLLCAMNIQWSNHWTEPQYRKALEEAGFSKISWKSLEPHVLSQLPGLSSLAPYLDYVLIHAEVKKHPRPLAAVIGSGMSGLIAAHLLEATHDVVIFEAGPKCGLVGLQEDLGGVAVDVPLRFMMPHYYQELLQVIRQLKIPTKAVPYNAAYQLMFTVFFRPELPNETFLEYMKRHKLHDHEAYRIYSLHLSWMLSCTYEQANGTPAGVILGFIRASNPFVRMYQSSGNILRVYPTMRALQDRLLEGKVLKVNSPVAPFNGSREIDGTMYDAVIVATDAPAAGYLLGGEWQAMLSKIHYQKGRIIVHKDPALMPPKKEDWRTFNVREDGPDSTCQITVWLNKFWGRDDLSENLFETWNPAQECSPDLKVKDVQLSRATYTTAMHELWSWIQEKQGQDGFYVAGAYTLEGMSLLEQACQSAQRAVRFFRISVLGASSSGKTSLINAFVNCSFMSRYVRTETARVYHKKTQLPDETEYHEVLRPILVEIEDTPGSERGFDEDDDAGKSAKKADGNPKILKGSRVVVVKDKQELMQLFDKFGQQSKGVVYKRAMENMLGKEFNVRSMGKDGSIYLPSPDGSEGGVWTFPPGAAKLKVSLTLPIDEFLNLAEKKEKVFVSQKEKKDRLIALQKPLSAYDRPVGAADVDKTLTRNRMGYFICFDVSDDSMASLKEAMAVHKLLTDSLKKHLMWSSRALAPYIWLVGCKSDKGTSGDDVRKNIENAEAGTSELVFEPLREPPKA
eukprot:g32752.t1